MVLVFVFFSGQGSNIFILLFVWGGGGRKIFVLLFVCVWGRAAGRG